MFDLFNWLPDYSHLTPALVSLYVLAGVFGALVRVAWLNKPLKGFYKDDEGLKMGFYAEVIVAVAVAITIDGHPVRAGIAAVFAPFILNAVKSFIEDKGPDLLNVLVRNKAGAEPEEDEDTE